MKTPTKKPYTGIFIVVIFTVHWNSPGVHQQDGIYMEKKAAHSGRDRLLTCIRRTEMQK